MYYHNKLMYYHSIEGKVSFSTSTCTRFSLLSIFNRGEQKQLTTAGKSTASDQRSRLIVALIETVGQLAQDLL